MATDTDILGVCENCSQWVRKSDYNDCFNQCRHRGFNPKCVVCKTRDAVVGVYCQLCLDNETVDMSSDELF